MNILTFDIEEWSIEKDYHGNRSEKYIEYDRILDQILEILDTHNTKATFFCLGKIAADFSHVIRKIASQGHEIGSHSNSHKWVNKMTLSDFKDDTHRAISSLEDLIGKKVKSFRAPAFSIGKSNKWAFEVLSEYGIENDASIFPGMRDYGGFPHFKEQSPCRVVYNEAVINEFPVPTCKLPIINLDIAYSGGGYFRFLPYNFIKNKMDLSDYNMCYFHIGDLINEKSKLMSRKEYESYFKEKGPLFKRLSRYFKTNIGRGNSLKKMERLIQAFDYTSIEIFLSENKIDKQVEI